MIRRYIDYIILGIIALFIGSLFFQIYSLKNQLNKELKRQEKIIDQKIKINDSLILSFKQKLKQAKKQDSILTKNVKYLKWKLYKYEQNHPVIIIGNNVSKDSIRAILTGQH